MIEGIQEILSTEYAGLTVNGWIILSLCISGWAYFFVWLMSGVEENQEYLRKKYSAMSEPETSNFWSRYRKGDQWLL